MTLKEHLNTNKHYINNIYIIIKYPIISLIRVTYINGILNPAGLKETLGRIHKINNLTTTKYN